MANELTVPLLPCASIDVMADFYGVLGFRSTYRQARPNPYLAVAREDLHLHFFGIPGFIPADSYGSCLVLVPDVGALHAAFAAGLRAEYGKVPVAGIPRMTRPRPKKNQDGVTGFSIVDPGGNWIRISARPGLTSPPEPPPGSAAEPASEPGAESALGAAGTESALRAGAESAPGRGAEPAPGRGAEPAPGRGAEQVPLAGAETALGAGAQPGGQLRAGAPPGGRLGVTLENAVVLGDSRGDHRQAAKILDGALTRPDAGEDPGTLVEALVYRAELAVTLGDSTTAHDVLARVRAVALTADERQRLAATLEAAVELAQ